MTLFVDVAALAEELAGTASRLQKRALIAEAIARVHATAPGNEDAGWFALYVAGQPFAESDARKVNAGGALVTKLVREISGATEKALGLAYRRHGDMGAAAFDLLQGRAPAEATLTLREVAETFDAMAVAKTTAMRTAAAEAMLRRATALEAKYLLKLMLGDMRIGVKQSLVEEAIAAAAGAEVAAVRHAVMLEADLARAVGRAFAGTLAEARMRLFHPLGFMLASPVESAAEAIERFTEIAKPVKAAKKKSKRKKRAELEAEFEAEMEEPAEVMAEAAPRARLVEALLEDKYDGMRAQLHCGEAGRVAIYSRNKEEVSESYPEIVEAFAGVGEELILDGEILGWDFFAKDEAGEVTPRALPFTVLGTRIGRKRVGNDRRRQVPVVFMGFDLLYERGELLLPLPLKERRNRLESVMERLRGVTGAPLEIDERASDGQAGLFAEPEGERLPRMMVSPARVVESAEEIDRAYAEARARANEGVMLKRADSAYLPGRRGLWWLKLKRELATLDVVVTAAEFGHGRRAGVLSDYTFAVRDEATGELMNVGKAYSGLTDAEIAEMTEWMKTHTLEDHGYWRTVEPEVVLEVAFNNVMRSGRHASGFALRFPRIVRIRTDKPVAEIDTVRRVEEVYLSQVDRPAEE